VLYILHTCLLCDCKHVNTPVNSVVMLELKLVVRTKFGHPNDASVIFVWECNGCAIDVDDLPDLFPCQQMIMMLTGSEAWSPVNVFFNFQHETIVLTVFCGIYSLDVATIPYKFVLMFVIQQLHIN
jgi:hypothetical protein